MNRVKELEALLARLPQVWRLVDGKLVKDVPAIPGDTIWSPQSHDGWAPPNDAKVCGCNNGKLIVDFGDGPATLSTNWECYATKEACKAGMREWAEQQDKKHK